MKLAQTYSNNEERCCIRIIRINGAQRWKQGLKRQYRDSVKVACRIWKTRMSKNSQRNIYKRFVLDMCE